MASDKCVNQSEWRSLMKKFDECAAKFRIHCSHCDAHGQEQEPGDIRVCSDSEEYFRIVRFDEQWSSAYQKHVTACELHQKFLGKLEKDVMDMMTEPETEDTGYIN